MPLLKPRSKLHSLFSSITTSLQSFQNAHLIAFPNSVAMVPYQPQLPLLLPTDHISYKASRVNFFKVSLITSLPHLQFFSDFHYKILWSLIWNPPKLQLHLSSLTFLPTKLLQLYIGHSPPPQYAKFTPFSWPVYSPAHLSKLFFPTPQISTWAAPFPHPGPFSNIISLERSTLITVPKAVTFYNPQSSCSFPT